MSENPQESAKEIEIAREEFRRMYGDFQEILVRVRTSERLFSSEEVEAMMQEAMKKCAYIGFKSENPNRIGLKMRTLGTTLYGSMKLNSEVPLAQFFKRVIFLSGRQLWNIFPQRWARYKAIVDAMHQVCFFLHRDFVQPEREKQENPMRMELRPYAFSRAKVVVVGELSHLLIDHVGEIRRRVCKLGCPLGEVEKNFVDAVVDCFKTLGIGEEEMGKHLPGEVKEMILGLMSGEWEWPR